MPILVGRASSPAGTVGKSAIPSYSDSNPPGGAACLDLALIAILGSALLLTKVYNR